jgi:hypothetical protein
MSDDKDLDQLREDTTPGDRAEMESVDVGFEDDLLEAVSNRNETGAQRTVSIWNANIAALLDALDENPERAERLVKEAADRYEISTDDVDRSEIVRVLIISGLAAIDPELKDSWTDAIGEHASQV